MNTEVLVAKIQRGGALGISNKLSHHYWRLKSKLYYAPQFAALGHNSIIRKPLFIANAKGIAIGAGCFVRDGARFEVIDRKGEAPGRLVLGNNVDIEQNVHIIACGEVIIGNDVCITAGVSIVDANHPVGRPGDGNRASSIDGGQAFVHIGNRAFIGIGTVILPNLSIGENSIIGAGSVVTTSIPANCVAVGSPARVIRRLSSEL